MHFIIPGDPTGKGRPQFSTVNGHAVARTPKKTRDYEAFVKMCYLNSASKLDFIDGYVYAQIDCFYAIPKSYSKKKRQLIEAGLMFPDKKPDCDNIAKGILDALNGIAYNDDKQVIELHVYKRFTERPRVEVTIKELTVD